MSSDVPSSYSDDAVRQQIRICLMRIKRDEAFVEGEGLASPDFQTIKKGKDESVKTKFINYVSTSLQLKKKTDKAALTKRLMHNNLMETEISNFNPNTYVMEDEPAPSEKKQTGAKGTSASKVEGGDKKDADGAGKKKRRRSSSLKPGKESKKGRIAFKMSESERRRLAKESKMEYLSQKSDVLERLPESHKKYWGQIMFGKWKKDPWRPVLVLGPYQVHPDLRDTWMKMFENVSCSVSLMFSRDNIVVSSLHFFTTSRPKATPSGCGTGVTGMDLQLARPTHNRKSILSCRTRKQ
jgi:hypothetical protein